MGAKNLFNKTDLITKETRDKLQNLKHEISSFLSNKEEIVEATICAVMSSGHILLEDVPGVGKTTFIKALAKMLDLDVSRIQFTSDLLPSDVIGVEIFDNESGKLSFHQGPIFSNIVIADELNRASPRTQSAMLEAMGEGMISVDKKSIELPKPFLIFASQNPIDSIGTYDIPESQLDRFSARLSLGYPDDLQELSIFQKSSADPLKKVPSKIIDKETLLNIQDSIDEVVISDETARYAKKIVDHSRNSDQIKLGISTRGGVKWLRMAKARALLEDRSYVTPDDLQSLAISCLSHRIITIEGKSQIQAIENLIQNTDVT